MRPAILTSTIWALAHEPVPVVPHRVTVVTTVAGRQAIRTELFTPGASGRPCVWEALRGALQAAGHKVEDRLRFGDTGDDIRVFTAPDDDNRSQELTDLTTAAHYEYAADTLLEVVRGLTELDDLQVIASISGGRNPLVSLLAGALALVGQPHDRLVHVLINSPFDSPSLQPPFYFPAPQPITHRFFDSRTRREQTIRSSEADLRLVGIPFVPLRRLFAAEPQLYHSRYSALARAYADRLSEIAGPLELQFDDNRGVLSVNGHPVELRGREHPFFAFLYDRWQRKLPPFLKHEQAYDPLLAFLGDWQARHPERSYERNDKDWITSCNIDEIAKLLNALRTRLRDAGLKESAMRLFPAGGLVGIPLAPTTKPPRLP